MSVTNRPLGQAARHVEHTIAIDAPATEIYRLLAEVTNWPLIFPPTIYVDRLEHDSATGPDTTSERIRIWATANGEAKQWTSRRVLDPQRLRIEFRQERSSPPVAAMGGTWVIEPRAESRSLVRLLHDYRAIDDDPTGLAWIDRAVDENSQSELAALKRSIERTVADADLLFSFHDTIEIAGPPTLAYDFVDQAQLWPERLPHVATVRLDEPSPGLQTLEMDTQAADGSTHTTKSFRVCLPHSKIVYKQTTLPALMNVHTGYWVFRIHEGRTLATSQHTVMLRRENITRILGADATVAQARDYVHHALSTNSCATLGHAKNFAEQPR